ncbi:MAG: hypothetical protein ACR2LQ_00860 [Acidimicrobiales bacterium]
MQSWLASVLYGGVDRLGGAGALLVLMGVVACGLAILVWSLTRPAGTVVPRLALAIVLLAIGVSYWTERPLTLGLVALCVALLCAEGRLHPRWLVAIFWVWVNVHGSFPLGLLALGALAFGRRLDGERPARELEALKWALLGCLIGGLNPLGPRLLVFPVELISKQGVLHNVIEWQSPAFTSQSDRAYLLLIVLSIVGLVRRPSWRAAVPLVVFVPLSLLSTRNIAVASIVVLPGAAAGLAGLGSLTGDVRRSTFRVAGATLVALGAIFGVGAVRSGPLDLHDYPAAAVDYARSAGLLAKGSRLVTQDFVGNYVDLVQGPQHETFIDDRFDMLPSALVDDYVVLLGGKPGWQRILDRYEASAVLWKRDTPLAQLLEESSSWTIVYRDGAYVIARRR